VSLHCERRGAEHRLRADRQWRLHPVLDGARGRAEQVAESIDRIGIGRRQLTH